MRKIYWICQLLLWFIIIIIIVITVQPDTTRCQVIVRDDVDIYLFFFKSLEFRLWSPFCLWTYTAHVYARRIASITGWFYMFTKCPDKLVIIALKTNFLVVPNSIDRGGQNNRAIYKREMVVLIIFITQHCNNVKMYLWLHYGRYYRYFWSPKDVHVFFFNVNMVSFSNRVHMLK